MNPQIRNQFDVAAAFTGITSHTDGTSEYRGGAPAVNVPGAVPSMIPGNP
jgi:hypothetical protein